MRKEDMDDRRNIDPGTEKAHRGNQQPSGTGSHATHAAEEERATKDRKAQGIAGRQKEKERGGG
jgi:hypothetical protein